MPDCGHRSATCIVGSFYTCKTEGCPNGPAAQPKVTHRAPAGDGMTFRKFIHAEATMWLTSYGDPGVELVDFDGSAARRWEADDTVEVRLRRKDPSITTGITVTWGRLLISGDTVAKVGRDPANGIPYLSAVVRRGLSRIQDHIANAPPGSGNVLDVDC
jgi:hypothetical protein